MQSVFERAFVWEHQGLILARQRQEDEATFSVVGDPCIVWDETIGAEGGWRMVLFADPPGHGEAMSTHTSPISAGDWEFLGPLPFTNPEAILGNYASKPFIVMDPYRSNHAARVDGRYYLLTISFLGDWRMEGHHKVVQRAWSEQLAGPWTLEQEPLMALGESSAFDGKHLDAVSGYYFPEREEFVYFYMGYPQQAQPRLISPFGSAQAVATQQRGSTEVIKHGIILPPAQQAGTWSSGYVGGLQLLPGRSVGSSHRWIGLVNASPTAPDPTDPAISKEEPAPSLGGFAYCDEEWPVQGWQWTNEPIEWIEQIPVEALAAGEGVNQWRHSLKCFL